MFYGHRSCGNVNVHPGKATRKSKPIGEKKMSATAIASDEQGTAAEDELDVGRLLDTVREFGLASLGLVAWEYCLPERAIAGAWAAAVSQGLLRSIGPCPETGEMMFAVGER
jgi:hypothetical protein